VSARDPVDAYLLELGRELSSSRRERARILAEVEDHLRESAAAHGAETALHRFGAVAEVAARFQAELAAGAAARTVRLLAVALVAFVGLCAAAQSRVVQAASPRSLGMPFGPLTLLALEVSWLVAAITALRWRRWRSAGQVPADAALAVARGAFVAAAAAFAGAALQAGALLQGPGPHGWSYAVLAGAIATAGATALVLAATRLALARARRAGATGAGDAFADMLELVGRSPAAGRLPRSLQAHVAPLDPRGHPWRFAVAFAVAVGVTFAAAKGVGEPDAGAGWAAAAGAAKLAGAQAGVVLVAFALLGRFLGLRGTRALRG
jgi:hypothetical protein